ncbi:uncharacterized protein ARMOST_21741 [Armillaria ostoyae]|uniref:Uncharacterized protein n=1 Tax=Armillaria ostoyae TaxID=47428 RepID=A0A284SB04_ARMOS|nr:uncharacterized protein ARMOST_21741 [Armillaria ostoyae]
MPMVSEPAWVSLLFEPNCHFCVKVTNHLSQRGSSAPSHLRLKGPDHPRNSGLSTYSTFISKAFQGQ